MTLLALLLAVFAAHKWPRDVLSPLAGRMALWWPYLNGDGGEAWHGWLAWGTRVALPAVLLGLVGGVLGTILWPLAWAWSAALLYLALAAVTERPVLREALCETFSGRFAPAFYWLLLGPLGLALYVLHGLFARTVPTQTPVAAVAARVSWWFDWLPARVVLLSLALVGNYEETLAAWRANPDLSATERLATLAPEADADADILSPLLWRVVILWFFVILLISLL